LNSIHWKREVAARKTVTRQKMKALKELAVAEEGFQVLAGDDAPAAHLEVGQPADSHLLVEQVSGDRWFARPRLRSIPIGWLADRRWSFACQAQLDHLYSGRRSG